MDDDEDEELLLIDWDALEREFLESRGTGTQKSPSQAPRPVVRHPTPALQQLDKALIAGEGLNGAQVPGSLGQVRISNPCSAREHRQYHPTDAQPHNCHSQPPSARQWKPSQMAGSFPRATVNREHQGLSSAMALTSYCCTSPLKSSASRQGAPPPPHMHTVPSTAPRPLATCPGVPALSTADSSTWRGAPTGRPLYGPSCTPSMAPRPPAALQAPCADMHILNQAGSGLHFHGQQVQKRFQEGGLCGHPFFSRAQSIDPHAGQNHERNFVPPCPHECCPGVYSTCGGALQWICKPPFQGFWGCCLYPNCEFRYYPPRQVESPQVSTEIISEEHFKVRTNPGSELAMIRARGLLRVLEQCGLDLGLAVSTQVSQGPAGQEVVFKLEHYEQVEKVLSRHRSLLPRSSKIPLASLHAYRGRRVKGTPSTADEVEARFGTMPFALRQALLPFQVEGVKFGLRRQGKCLIADEMGVGKTVQAIALAACYQDHWPLLVIVPASLRLVWAEEFEKWLPHLRPAQVHVIEGKDDRLSGRADHVDVHLPPITITSYEMMKRLSCSTCQAGFHSSSSTGPGARSGKVCSGPAQCMAALPWGMIIVDESHNLRTTGIKNHDSPHTEACVAAIKKSSHAVLLSGTPSLARPYDLYRQVDAINPGLLGQSKEEFSTRYCDRRLVPCSHNRAEGEIRMKYDNSGGSRLYELHGLLKREVMIRRLKKDVVGQLPPKRRQVVRLPRPPAERWPGHGESNSGVDEEDLGIEDDEEDAQHNAAPEVEQPCLEAPRSDLLPPTTTGKMSAAHRTALAKLPDVIDWLLGALGVRDEGRRRKPRGNKPFSMKEPSSSVGEELQDEDLDSAKKAGDSEELPKFLVFAHHRDVMDLLAEALSGFDSLEPSQQDSQESSGSRSLGWSGVKFVRIDGSHDSLERLQAVRRFKNDPQVRVALLSITAAAVGLDFSSASVVVFVELPVEVALVRQAEDRAHRKGQTKSVNVYFLCAKGTCDDRRWQALNSSLTHINQVHDGPDPGGTEAEAQGKTRADYEDHHPGAKRPPVYGQGLELDAVVDLEMCPEGGVDVTRALKPGCCEGLRVMQDIGSDRGGSAVMPGSHCGDPAGPDGSGVSDIRLSPPHMSAAVSMDEMILSQMDMSSCQAVVDAVDVTQEAPEDERTCNMRVAKEGKAVRSSLLTAGLTKGNLGVGPGPLDIDVAPSLQVQGIHGGQMLLAGGHKDVQAMQGCAGGLLLTRDPEAGGHESCRSVDVVEVIDTDQDEEEPGAIRNDEPKIANKFVTTTQRDRVTFNTLSVHGEHGQSPDLEAAHHDGPLVAGTQFHGLEPVGFWLEVSPHTSRIHFHLAADGSDPLGLSLPLEVLAMEDAPEIRQILEAVDKEGEPRSRQTETMSKAAGTNAEDSFLVPHGDAPGFLGPCGLVAVSKQVTSTQLKEMLCRAQEFVREWQELRSVTRHRLHGKVLSPCLQDAVDTVTAQAVAKGAMGQGTERYLGPTHMTLPEGCAWRTVRVKLTGQYQKGVREYKQAFNNDGLRLCLHCLKVVPDCVVPADAVLENGVDLFCSLDCERLFTIKSGSSAIRYHLYALERGVCQMCGVDCHALVQALQTIRRGSSSWEERRRAVIRRLHPCMATNKSYRSYFDKLVVQATEGQAWHADHIIPVYLGGGICELDNLRTLCVPCHADVTKKQCRERAAEKKRKAMKTPDIRSVWGKVGKKVPLGAEAGPSSGAEVRGGGVRRSRNSSKRQCLDDDGRNEMTDGSSGKRSRSDQPQSPSQSSARVTIKENARVQPVKKVRNTKPSAIDPSRHVSPVAATKQQVCGSVATAEPQMSLRCPGNSFLTFDDKGGANRPTQCGVSREQVVDMMAVNEPGSPTRSIISRGDSVIVLLSPSPSPVKGALGATTVDQEGVGKGVDHRERQAATGAAAASPSLDRPQPASRTDITPSKSVLIVTSLQEKLGRSCQCESPHCADGGPIEGLVGAAQPGGGRKTRPAAMRQPVVEQHTVSQTTSGGAVLRDNCEKRVEMRLATTEGRAHRGLGKRGGCGALGALSTSTSVTSAGHGLNTFTHFSFKGPKGPARMPHRSEVELQKSLPTTHSQGDSVQVEIAKVSVPHRVGVVDISRETSRGQCQEASRHAEEECGFVEQLVSDDGLRGVQTNLPMLCQDQQGTTPPRPTISDLNSVDSAIPLCPDVQSTADVVAGGDGELHDTGEAGRSAGRSPICPHGTRSQVSSPALHPGCQEHEVEVQKTTIADSNGTPSAMRTRKARGPHQTGGRLKLQRPRGRRK